MSFNYIEHRRKSGKESTSPESSGESSIGSGDPEGETQGFPMVEENVGGGSKEEKTVPEHVCEECEKLGIDDKPATRKSR